MLFSRLKALSSPPKAHRKQHGKMKARTGKTMALTWKVMNSTTRPTTSTQPTGKRKSGLTGSTLPSLKATVLTMRLISTSGIGLLAVKISFGLNLHQKWRILTTVWTTSEVNDAATVTRL